MSKGIIIFAFNNEKVDYVNLAANVAKCARDFLNLPNALITNRTPDRGRGIFDRVITVDYMYKRNTRKYADYNEEMDFKNVNRFSAFDLSPFDQSILLDADYLINSDNLLKAFELDESYLLPRRILSIAGDKIQDTYFHIAGIPIHWATAVYFDKSKEAQRLFDCVAHVKDNWNFYASRYKFPSNLYRNDYAFSIAHHLLSGRTTSDREFPVNFRLAGVDDEMLEIKDGALFHRKFQNCVVRISGFDIHVMHKASLQKCLTSAH